MLLCVNTAYAALGTDSPQTWYVRSAAACVNNGDGLAYGCASSVGSSGAFRGFSSIRWTATTGVDNGDTLYVCGAHTTELRPLAKVPYPGAVRISGACAGDNGSINTTSVSNTTDAIRFEGAGVAGYIVEDIHVKGARNGILVHAAETKKGFTIQRTIFDQRSATTTTNACHMLSFIGTAQSVYTNIVIQNNQFLGAHCANKYNDAIHIERAYDNILVKDNVISGPGTAGGIDISGLTIGNYVITGNIIADTFNVALRIEGSLGCVSGLTIENNSIPNFGYWGMSLIDVSNSVVRNNVVRGVSPSSTSRGAVMLKVENACSNSSNSFINNIFEADYSAGVVIDYSSTLAGFSSGNVFLGNSVRQLGPHGNLMAFLVDPAHTITLDNAQYVCQCYRICVQCGPLP